MISQDILDYRGVASIFRWPRRTTRVCGIRQARKSTMTMIAAGPRRDSIWVLGKCSAWESMAEECLSMPTERATAIRAQSLFTVGAPMVSCTPLMARSLIIRTGPEPVRTHLGAGATPKWNSHQLWRGRSGSDLCHFDRRREWQLHHDNLRK